MRKPINNEKKSLVNPLKRMHYTEDNPQPPINFNEEFAKVWERIEQENLKKQAAQEMADKLGYAGWHPTEIDPEGFYWAAPRNAEVIFERSEDGEEVANKLSGINGNDYINYMIATPKDTAYLDLNMNWAPEYQKLGKDSYESVVMKPSTVASSKENLKYLSEERARIKAELEKRKNQ